MTNPIQKPKMFLKHWNNLIVLYNKLIILVDVGVLVIGSSYLYYIENF